MNKQNIEACIRNNGIYGTCK